MLRKLADFFGVSVDYLLGRTSCKDINVITVAANIKLIKANLPSKRFSKDIFRKTGTMITPEMLELYTSGERMPFIGTIRILSQYASVPESFYRHNTLESYHQGKSNVYKRGTTTRLEYSHDSNYAIPLALNYMDINLAQWVLNKNNLEYIRLAREIQETDLPIDSIRSVIDVLKSINESSK